MKKLGFIGQRGMVGQVLSRRMSEESNWQSFETTLFSTSSPGAQAPVLPYVQSKLGDAHSIEQLIEMDLIVSCQGGEYTKSIHPKLRNSGWRGEWIDAASYLRMSESSIIVLDPVNGERIKQQIDTGTKDFIGGNCTVSLMLMSIGALFKEDLVEWTSAMTYQAASGAGARAMMELLKQMEQTTNIVKQSKGVGALELEQKLTLAARNGAFEHSIMGSTLNLGLIPWIDSPMDNGQTKEEWKAQTEANKILNTSRAIPIDGTCVRVGALRCHSQALTIKLNKSVDIKTIEQILEGQHQWSKLVFNNKDQTVANLSPHSVSGGLDIFTGRVRKMNMGDKFLNVFTVGDQLLWGAAEPLRRTIELLATK